MSDSPFDSAELFIAKQDGRTTVRLFQSTPTPLEEKNLGRLYAVLEIDSRDAVNDDILNSLIHEISAQYYHSETFEIESAFEHALQKGNQKIQELIRELGEDWLNSVNAFIGVQKERQLVFTTIGRMIALMVYKNKVVDILDTAATKLQPINPVKVFSNIVAGEVVPNSTFLFSTETILDYLSKEKIKRILDNYSAEESAEELYSLLEEDTSTTNFAALIIEHDAAKTSGAAVVPKDIPVVNPVRPQRPASTIHYTDADSMSSLLGKQHRTEELLSNSIWSGMKKALRNYRQERANTSGEREERDAVHDTTKQRTDFQRIRAGSASASHSAGQYGQRVGRGLLVVFGWLRTGVSAVAQWVRSLFHKQSINKEYGGQRSRRRSGGRSGVSASSMVSAVVQRLVRWFTSLTILQRVFIVVAVVVLIIFAQAIVNRGEEKISKDQEQGYSSELAAIDLKINEGRAAALFDNSAARQQLIDARNALDAIPKESQSYEERGEELYRIIAEELVKVNNIVSVDQPTVALDFRSIDPNIQLKEIILLGASMYGFDKNNQSVYRGNLETKGTSVTISRAANSNAVVSAAKASPGTGVVVLGDQTLATFNPVAEQITPLTISYANPNRRLVDVSVFGTRLYALDAANNQIYRHRKTDETFSDPEPWLSANTDLSAARSFAIDGSIYVVDAPATLMKFSAGSQDTGFALGSIDPALEHIDMVVTDENTTNLYLMDRVGKRIVVFTKEGKLQAQYTSDQFTDLLDVIVNEAGKKMYVLNGAQVYEVTLQ